MSVIPPTSLSPTNEPVTDAILPPVRIPPIRNSRDADLIQPTTAVETQAAMPLAAEASSPASVEPLELDDTDANRCTQCRQSMDVNASVCDSCGYYATLGTYIDLQKEEQGEPAEFPWKMLYIPTAMLVVLVESLIAAFVTHPESPDRTQWSILHLVFGALMFAIPHMRAQFRTAKADANTGMADFLMHPLHIWRRDFREYPKSLPWMVSAGVGLTAVFCSLIVIRGLPSPFLDEPIQIKKKKNLTVLVQEASQHTAESMEEALNEIADVDVVTAASVHPEDDDKKREYVDCVIVGYNVAPENPNRVSSLVIASEINGRLEVVGNLTQDIPEDIRLKLANELNKIRTVLPVTKSRHQANWVKPKYFCRTWHHEAEDDDKGTGKSKNRSKIKSKKNSRIPFHFDRMLLLK